MKVIHKNQAEEFKNRIFARSLNILCRDFFTRKARSHQRRAGLQIPQQQFYERVCFLTERSGFRHCQNIVTPTFSLTEPGGCSRAISTQDFNIQEKKS